MMLPSDWLPIVAEHESRLLSSLDLDGYTFVQGGPFGNSLEFRPGAQWMVLEAEHPHLPKRAVRLPIHERFTREDHLQRLTAVSQKLVEHEATWFPEFELKSYDFGEQVTFRPCPIMVMDWIEGETYASALWKQRKHPNSLADLQMNFSRLMDEMRETGFDHGDISVTNLRVMPNGMMMLLDPDSLSHVEISINKSLELGHPTWNHPGRSEQHTRNLHVIPEQLMSWLNTAMQNNPNLLSSEPDVEEFFYTVEDLKAPHASPRFKSILEACGKEPGLMGKVNEARIRRLMDALVGDFDNISDHIYFEEPKPKPSKVNIDYLTKHPPKPANIRKPSKLNSPTKRFMNPVPFGREFERFNFDDEQEDRP